jgi:hypothetical protein
MQPVPLVEYSDRSRDGVNQRHLQSESDQDAIRKGLLFVFIDCDEIHIEGDIDADGNVCLGSNQSCALTILTSRMFDKRR